VHARRSGRSLCGHGRSNHPGAPLFGFDVWREVFAEGGLAGEGGREGGREGGIASSRSSVLCTCFCHYYIQVDPFGHSSTQASLLSGRYVLFLPSTLYPFLNLTLPPSLPPSLPSFSVGFEALYFGRVDYQDMILRKKRQQLKFMLTYPSLSLPPFLPPSPLSVWVLRLFTSVASIIKT